MNLIDFREKIIDSDNEDFLKSLSVTISYPHLNYNTTLNGLSNIYNFVLNQVKGWNEYESLNPSLNSSKFYFESIKSEMIDITAYLKEEEENNFASKWHNSIIPRLQKFTTNNNESIFLYDSPETKFLIDLSGKNSNYLSGAKDYLSNENIKTIQDKDYLSGTIQAYEFKNQDHTNILQRRNQEKASLSKIRTIFQNHLNESESHLNDYLQRTKDSLTVHFEDIDNLKKDKTDTFDNWFKDTEDNFKTFYSNAEQSITINEDLYKEKLRLAAPAEYWKQRGQKLKDEAQKFLFSLITLIILSAIALFVLLFQIPDGMLLKVFDDKITAIKWSIILITMMTLLAYGIKILAKLTFSSYHLSRDSEEREQLTHFYLALKQDSSVTDSDRQLILQSLFSRADSGLLKDDSSPTMPSSIVEKYIDK